nr:hypothetical protein [Tanacetum cinerariifolium]
MFPEESNKIEKYIRGLPDMIHGSIVASKPKTMQEAVEIATELMDKKIYTFVERETASKRKYCIFWLLEENGTKTNYQHVMLSEVQMAMIAVIMERGLEGQNELLVNVLTLTFSSVNHYTSMAQRELPVFPN